MGWYNKSRHTSLKIILSFQEDLKISVTLLIKELIKIVNSWFDNKIIKVVVINC